MEKNYKLIIGFITYGDSTAKYLPYFLESIKNQTFKDFKILAIDNTEVENNKNAKFIKENYPKINFKWAGKNLGFAKAFNIMINEAIEMEAEYFLCINPDMILDPNAISELMEEITADSNIGAVQPKILKWDYANKRKTDIIDSLGLIIDKNFRFYDDKQSEIDTKNTGIKEIFGFTGAAVMFRIKALKDVAFLTSPRPSLLQFGGQVSQGEGNRNEYFDELMFMYKEDCDLSLRMRLAGWKIILAPAAIVYHDRTVAITSREIKNIFKSRLNKSRQVKKWSFLNQWILLIKYYKLPYSLTVKMATYWYQIKNMIFVIMFEQYLLKEFFKALKLLSEIKEKRDQLKIRISVRDIEKMME